MKQPENVPASQSLPEPLTHREKEILGLLADGLNSPEIAERLVLAVSSVRWYLQQIYGKLGVNSKRQAVTRARELGLLSSAPPQTAVPPVSRPERQLPTGLVTFLFTDIEGSTPLWETEPDAMSTAIASHHVILREVIEAHAGVVVKIIGDAFQAAFALAPQALEAAVQIQRRLAGSAWPEQTGPIKVRMGLHTGQASLDERGDYAVSHTLNRVARVMSAGYGGQILLSQEAKDLIERSLPSSISFKDLGEHRLKGLSIPEHLYQVTAPGLVEAFPPPDTAVHPHNLPPELTTFIGREHEIADLRTRFEAGTQRLLTLTGSGGTGKTRLALQAARTVIDLFPDGVWLVELAALSDPRLLVSTLAQTLGVHQVSSTPYQETLANYLRKKHLLLILDNCEHMLQECSRVADFLLHRCPKLYLLATSREILNLAGEATFRVPSLTQPPAAAPQAEGSSLSSAVPQSGNTQDHPGSLMQYESVQLFHQRARQVSPDFHLDESNAAAVATICRRLDGVPLAIELAAARVRMMTAPQIAARLDRVFRLLTGGSRNVLPRQQTLKAAIDWSYALLSPKERVMLQRLSVFAGRWTLEGAEAVCPGEEIETDEVLDLLGGLCDKSLVQVRPPENDPDSGIECYRMLETVRQYARDRLVESGGGATGDDDSGLAVRDRHLRYYLKLSEQAAEEITGPKQIAWLARLEDELENLRLALEWSGGTGNSAAERVENGLRLAVALMWFWQMHNHNDEGITWLANLMQAAGIPTPVQGEEDEQAWQSLLKEEHSLDQKLVWIRAMCAVAFLGDYSVRYFPYQPMLLLERSITLCRAIGSLAERELAWALSLKGWNLPPPNSGGEKPELRESLDICRRNGYRFLEAFCLGYHEASVYNGQAGADIREKALAIFETMGETDNTGNAMVFLALWLYFAGDRTRPKGLLKRGLPILKKVGNNNGWCRGAFLQYCLYPEPVNAHEADEALVYLLNRESPFYVIGHMAVYAEAQWSSGDYEKAEQIAHQALAAIQTTHNPYIVTLSFMVLGRCALSQGDLDGARECFEKMTVCWGNSEDYSIWAAKSCLDSIGVFLAAIGKMDASVKVFAALDKLYRVFLYGALQRSIHEHDAALAAARQALGEEAFEKAWQAGKAMTLEEAFDFGQRHIKNE